MDLSDFGRKVSAEAGILQLMDDLGKALAGDKPLAMFGGGNPAQIPEVTAALKGSLEALIQDHDRLSAMMGNYDTPQGNAEFIATMVEFLNRHHKLGITADNIAITSGSQSGYFMLFNLLGGQSGGKLKRVLFPIVPEYIGYADQAMEPEMFVSLRPKIEKIGEHEFKYHIDFGALEKALDDSIAAICVSRPTNPSGNVVTNEELKKLGQLAADRDIPLLIDNAYGQPFPGVIKQEAELFWNGHTVLSMSLSKVGLPAARVGIFIGPPKLMQALSAANAVVSLASPSFGQYVVRPLIENDEIISLSKKYIRPYYYDRAKRFSELADKHFPKNLPWRLHEHEGSYFFWLWCEGAKLTSKQMYTDLKKQGVLVVPGEYFFPGQDTSQWSHAHECLRLNFSRPDAELEAGIPILAGVIRRAYE